MVLLSRSSDITTVYNNYITVYIVYIDSRQLYMYIYTTDPIHILYGWSLRTNPCRPTQNPGICKEMSQVVTDADSNSARRKCMHVSQHNKRTRPYVGVSI